MDPSAPGRALAQFLQPWETPLQGCRAFQHLAKPLWLPAVCEGFSPLSWSRAVAPGKSFLRKLEQGWRLRSAVRESSCLPSRPPAQQSCPQQPPLLTQPLGQDAWGRGHTASTSQHKVLLITAPVHPVPSQGSPGSSSSTFQWPVPCTGVQGVHTGVQQGQAGCAGQPKPEQGLSQPTGQALGCSPAQWHKVWLRAVSRRW